MRDSYTCLLYTSEITWSNNLLIMSGCKPDEAKEFYMRLCIANGYGKRELERQIDSMLYEMCIRDRPSSADLRRAGRHAGPAGRDAAVYEH